MKVFCYGQQCSGRNGGVVPESEIQQWFDEHPDAPEGEDYCDDWDLVASGAEDEIVSQCREIIRTTTAADSNAAFRRRQCRNVLEMFHRPETPARMIDAAKYLVDGQIVAIGEEFDREDLESEQPEKVGCLTGWCPFTEVWKIDDNGDVTYYIVAK